MTKFYISAIAVVIVIICGLALENNRLERHNTALEHNNEVLQSDLTVVQLERELARADYTAALGEIDRQNAEIKTLTTNMEHNAEMAEVRITELAVQAGRMRTEYVERLVADPSCENQLRLIREAQGVFYDENR